MQLKSDQAAWAEKSEGAPRLGAMIDIAKRLPGMAVTMDELDADPYLLCVRNGVIDLRTGALRDGRREDLITMQAGCEFDPAATCPEFERFLDWVCMIPPQESIDALAEGDREQAQKRREDGIELREYLLTAMGYALTGVVDEECFFFLHGTGGNGKGTLTTVLQAILGDYATTLRKDCLMAKNVIEIPNDIARLKGKRAVFVHEVPGKAFDEALLKSLTGKDIITARFMRQEWFDFKPTFKLFISGNVRPDVKSFDAGMARRLREIPFLARVSEADQDLGLKDVLLSQMAGILNLLVRYCVKWQSGRLTVPKAVRAAGEEYQAYSDRVGRFLESETLRDEFASVRAQRLFDRYRNWAKRTGEEYVYSLRRFGEKLKEKGMPWKRTAEGVVYMGLDLRTQTDAQEPEGGV